MKKKQVGLTMLETLLVLVIAGFIIVFSFRQYLSYRYHANLAQVQTNLDNLFQAMFLYYRANCEQGTLAPKDPFETPHKIDIQEDLKDKGFLTEKLHPSPLVDATKHTKGYSAQFNLVTPPPTREVCVTKECEEKKPIGKIVIWIPQISIHFKEQPLAAAYGRLLGAECLSKSAEECLPPKPGQTRDYLIFERMPVNANPRARSSYWGTMPTVHQFKQMYSTMPIGSSGNGIQTQYFVCGG